MNGWVRVIGTVVGVVVWLALVAAVSAAPAFVRLPGTALELPAPLGFEPSRFMPGFEHPETGAAIVVNRWPRPPGAAGGGFPPDPTLVIEDQWLIGGAPAAIATVAMPGGPGGDTEPLAFVQRPDALIQVTAMVPGGPQQADFVAAVRRAFRGIRLIADEERTVPLLPVSITPAGGFKQVAAVPGRMVVYLDETAIACPRPFAVETCPARLIMRFHPVTAR